jgi:hypothetical protein
MARRTRTAELVVGAVAGLVAVGVVAGCTGTPVAPAHPTWADVAPIMRAECNSCHGWTANDTGGGYRLDFYDRSTKVCGDAALALDPLQILAGTPLASGKIRDDVIPQGTSMWARMPPLPSPALADWQRETIENWAMNPVKGPPAVTNRPPTIAVSQLPATAGDSLAFTAILDDPDGDSVIGAIEINGLGFLMNRSGSFAVAFDTSTFPTGSQRMSAVLCDGWAAVTYDLGPILIKH